MKAFFDTNVYINTFFKTTLPQEEFEKFFLLYEIVICPIVKHELLLGTIHNKTKENLEHFFSQSIVLEAPTKEMWESATQTMKKLNWKENRQQNDILIAITAKKDDATLITYDTVFQKLEKEIGFDLVLLEED